MKTIVTAPGTSRVFYATLIATAIVALPIAGFAESSRASPDAPTYAVPANADGNETVSGRITWFDGRFDLQIRDDRGFIDNVQLRQGTVINPTGLTLRTGMPVQIRGRNRGFALVAVQIDSPGRSQSAPARPQEHAAVIHTVPPPARDVQREWRLYAERLKQFHHEQYLAAQAAAQRLTVKLERLYGHPPARVAVARPRVTATHKPHRTVTSLPPTRSVADAQVLQHRAPAPHKVIASGRTAQRHHVAAPLPASIFEQTWFGWGKL
jgi:hypothetical protein